jgi:hypothetical protein
MAWGLHKDRALVEAQKTFRHDTSRNRSLTAQAFTIILQRDGNLECKVEQVLRELVRLNSRCAPEHNSLYTSRTQHGYRGVDRHVRAENSESELD